MHPPEPSRSPVITLRGVSQRYKSVVALDDISLDIPAGIMAGLIGPDGVGKSTLLDLISGARAVQTGEVMVLDGNMASARHRGTAGPRIAYMPQGLGKNLYHTLSVRENLTFFARLFGLTPGERDARIARLTQATGLDPFLSRPAGKLSGGMKQKLGLCCSLLHDPDLLILDEPTTGVDPLSRRQFWQLIAGIRADRPAMSVLVSTAYMDEAQGFDWLVAMDAGRVLDTGTAQELMAKTSTDDLEAAFVQLLPEEKRANARELVIPPLEDHGDTPAITARHLTRRFGDFTAVKDVSFEIKRGEIFGFLGSNGCGKTTTMKMLTGLLPMSEGEAYLFGQPVDASDIEMRKRVGFMSQAFSLYGELTVEQNLSLHARLFRLDPAASRERIAALADRFGLSPHMDSPSGDLPLGLRQRLSLAVAVLHEPEILILDEPTSGVDPVARDDFWELLVELSRGEGVTIFISTHFMNEALRCDRISLMHAGEVLVADTPDGLVEKRGAETLEEAFIGYIEDAIGDRRDTDVIPTQDRQPESAPKRKRHRGFSMARLLAYSMREAMEVVRDPIRLAFAFVGSALLLVVLSYGVSMDVEDLTMAALDLDQTPASRDYVANLSGSRYFEEQPPLQSVEELEKALQKGEVTVAIEIPNGFGRDLRQGQSPEISAWVDGANTMRAGTIEGYVNAAHVEQVQKVIRDAGHDPEASETYAVESRYRYNPTFESINAMGPAIPAILLMMFPAILMAVSVAREKEIGTITNFYVTPTTKIEFLVGKQLPYVVIGLVNFFLLLFLITTLLGVTFKGSLLTMTLAALVYVVVSTSYGLLISTLANSQVAAVFTAALLSMMPTVQFSGMVQPISTLTEGGQMIGNLWPASYFVRISVGTITKGLGLEELSADVFWMMVFVPVFLGLALMRLRKQER